MLKRYREFRESVKSKFGELIDFPPTSKYYTSGKDRDKWIKEIDRIVTPKDVFNEVKFKKFNESNLENILSIRDEFEKFKSIVDKFLSNNLEPVLNFVLDIEDLMITREEDYNIEHNLCNLRIEIPEYKQIYLDFNTKESTINMTTEFESIEKKIEFIESVDDSKVKLDVDIGSDGIVAEKSVIEKIISEIRSRYTNITIIKTEIHNGRITLKIRIGDL